MPAWRAAATSANVLAHAGRPEPAEGGVGRGPNGQVGTVHVAVPRLPAGTGGVRVVVGHRQGRRPARPVRHVHGPGDELDAGAGMPVQSGQPVGRYPAVRIGVGDPVDPVVQGCLRTGGPGRADTPIYRVDGVDAGAICDAGGVVGTVVGDDEHDNVHPAGGCGPAYRGQTAPEQRLFVVGRNHDSHPTHRRAEPPAILREVHGLPLPDPVASHTWNEPGFGAAVSAGRLRVPLRIATLLEHEGVL